MKTRNLLYLILLMVMMFIGIPKTSNAAPPDNPCHTITITCPDGSKASGYVCSDEDFAEFIRAFCKIEINIEIIS